VTITFASGASYPVGATCTVRIGTLPAGAMTLHVANAAAVTPQSGTLGGPTCPATKGTEPPSPVVASVSKEHRWHS
jgi:hypothetical protein